MIRKLFTFALVAAFFAMARSASAENPTQFDFEFSGNGGAINDYAVQWFFADPVPAGAANLDIVYLELEIFGLQHSSPMDLNIFLLDPFGTGIELMDDRGDQHGIGFTAPFNLVFSDKGIPLPLDPDPLVNNTMYAPEGPGSFSMYTNTGNDQWRLVIIDDSDGDQGEFASFTLRGLVVPEPATVSLLMIGAVALLRRRHA